MFTMQRALLPAAFGALLISSAFGQAGVRAVVDAGKDAKTKTLAPPPPRLLVDYSAGGGIIGVGTDLTIYSDGKTKVLERRGRAMRRAQEPHLPARRVRGQEPDCEGRPSSASTSRPDTPTPPTPRSSTRG